MPIYEYEHLKNYCALGKIFDHSQSIKEAPLTCCPKCGEPIRKLISLTNINTPKTNSELRDLGFTKLVRRDKGVYENVTARDGDSKMVHHDKPETMPNLKKTIRD
ncbi:MAG: zinc ribbon domain-containing protein [Deltaproteobacteria bacterium]|nr:zinc ribbon domain-containing protein [Deltaproteobacteria bacterium]